ncbi:MAG: glycosyltransferase family 39 protein [Patescibacteria group bacterium]|nr:glycosyltransferase family 39 protein [Patescibacteria group bacterium]
MKKFIEKNKSILILLFLVFLLRLPSLFEPYWYGDEGVHLTVGLALRRGYLLYQNIYDNKPPLMYLLMAAANGTLFWARFFLLISMLVATYLFYRLCQKIFNNNKAVITACITFLILTTARFWEGNIANAENFMLLPTIAGFYLTLSLFSSPKSKVSSWLTLAAGMIFSLSFLLKAPGLFDFLAVIFFLSLLQKKEAFFSWSKKNTLLVLGFFLPFFFTSLFFLSKGIFKEFFQVCFLQMLSYISSWQSGSHSFSLVSFLKTDLVIKGAVVTFFSLLLLLNKKRFQGERALIPLWFIFTLFAATLSGRPYAHYLLLTVPALSLGFGWLWEKKHQLPIMVVSIMFIFLLGAEARYHFWFYPTFSYYQNFVEFAFGKKSQTNYFAYFDKQTPFLYRLADYINTHTNKEDKIFIWADLPTIYALSQRSPASPYTVAYHINELKSYNLVAAKIREGKPSLIAIDQRLKTFPALDQILSKDYLTKVSFDNFLIYQKKIFN